MGNQLAGIAPSQIFPVEYYFNEAPALQFESSMGSTRFMKVARASSDQGPVVVKVFVLHDPSLPVDRHRRRVADIQRILASVPNCLPYRKALLKERCALLVRQYIRYSLYDRISTRPFLSEHEKRWLAFQLLNCLAETHRLGVCHGDLKLENLLVTSFLWLAVADWASYKPSLLPDDNPADFGYFFDTSRRRLCYLAPERFVSGRDAATADLSTLPASTSLLTESFPGTPPAATSSTSERPCTGEIQGGLTPAMDLFSVGCCLTELWTDGGVPFDLPQLLLYRCGEYDLQPLLNEGGSNRVTIEAPVQQLLSRLMSLDPSRRGSARQCLDDNTPLIFPASFGSVLHPYMAELCSSADGRPLLSVDQRLNQLADDADQLMERLTAVSPECLQQDVTLLVGVATSLVRRLSQLSTKLRALRLLHRLSQRLSAQVMLDRVLPYVLHFCRDSAHRVRAAALRTVSALLRAARSSPDDALMPEYVLPLVAPLAQDSAVSVRVCYAAHLSHLAVASLRFLLAAHHRRPRASLPADLTALHDLVHQKIQLLLTDTENAVRRTLLARGFTQLCSFFGRHKSGDLLLSHMITFLNDTGDASLRAEFFDTIESVAASIGRHCVPLLTPLLIQGLSDSEELVAVAAADAMTRLATGDLLTTVASYSMLEEVAPLLVHPSLWLRHAAVGFVCACAARMSIAEVHCRLMSMLKPMLAIPLASPDDPVMVLSSLSSAIPRTLFDIVARAPELPAFLDVLSEREQRRKRQKSEQLGETSTRGSPLVMSTTSTANLSVLFRRLSVAATDETQPAADRSAGRHDNTDGLAISTQTQEHLLLLSAHLLKLHQHRKQTAEQWLQQRHSSAVSGGVVQLEAGRCQANSISLTQPPLEEDSLLSTDEILSQIPECQRRFNAMVERLRREYQASSTTSKSSLLASASSGGMGGPSQGAASGGGSWGELPSSWRPRGQLVAHVHEHQGAVVRLAAIADTALFASAATDGQILLWDAARMEGRNICNRSVHTYSPPAGTSGLTALTYCPHERALATASVEGEVWTQSVESHPHPLHVRKLDLRTQGVVSEMAHLAPSILVYATGYGQVVGWDLRAPGCAWTLHNKPSLGLLTAMCVDPRQNWLVVGTSSGVHVCWDLRFQLSVASMLHPSGSRVRRLVPHPNQPSWFVSAVSGNSEVNMWNIETGERQMALWPSQSPLLSSTSRDRHSVCALHVPPCCPSAGGLHQHRSSLLLTAGTDMCVRLWDLQQLSTGSQLVSWSALQQPGAVSVSATYKTQVVDGIEVVQEVSQKTRRPAEADCPRGPDPTAPGHRDSISDMLMTRASQWLLVTASRDGVVKVWK